MRKHKGKYAATSYGNIAFLYDTLDSLTGNSCDRTRNLFLGHLPETPRNVLEIGCGTGKFASAFLAAENPESLTLNDLSGRMLERAQAKVAKTGWQGRLSLIQGDMTQRKPEGKFDLVVLHFIMNVFPMADRAGFLSHAAGFLSEGGTLWVSDFNRPTGFWQRLFFHINWWITVLFFWIVAGNRPNAMGDLEPCFAQTGLSITARRILPGGSFASFLLKKSAVAVPAP